MHGKEMVRCTVLYYCTAVHSTCRVQSGACSQEALCEPGSGSCTNSHIIEAMRRKSARGTLQTVLRVCSDPIRAPEGILTGKLYVCSVCFEKIR